MLTDCFRPGIGGCQLQESKSTPSLYPPQHGPVVPSW